MADAHSATPAQIALAWAIRRPGVVAIPGASSVGQLESNVAAAGLDLAEDEYQALCAAADRFRQLRFVAAKFLNGNISQSGNARQMSLQKAYGFFALGAAAVVFGIDEAPRLVCV